MLNSKFYDRTIEKAALKYDARKRKFYEFHNKKTRPESDFMHQKWKVSDPKKCNKTITTL